MRVVIDDLVVAAIVLTSVVYAACSLGPRNLRVRLAVGAGSVMLRLPAFLGLGIRGQRLLDAASAKIGGCGGCDSCGSEAKPIPATGAEVRIPLSKIGKR